MTGNAPLSRRAESSRTRVACRRCNSKKIKCTASWGVPCRKCVVAGSRCELIDSQRGRYTRRSRTMAETSAMPLVTPPDDDSAIPVATPASAATVATTAASATRNRQTTEIRSEAGSAEQDAIAAQHSQLLQSLSQSFERQAPRDANALFYTHLTDLADKDQDRGQDQGRSSGNMATFYAGESFSLTYAIHEVARPLLQRHIRPGSDQRDANHSPPQLYFSIAKESDPSTFKSLPDVVLAQLQTLRERGACHLLDQDTTLKLLDGYFTWFHPGFPVVDQRQVFVNRFLDNKLSLLVLNAVLLVAISICDDDLLESTGFATRHQGRECFYHQAKILHDNDLDADKVNNVVATFLMSFWWGGSNDQKDSWYWLGIAVSSAQSLGMHRSTKSSCMGPAQRQLWRRLWWCLRIRDTLTGASIGRPLHFQDRDCDVEMLQLKDMPCFLSTEGSQHPQGLYACQMARFSTIISDIITSRYAASNTIQASTSRSERLLLENRLDQFRRQIPPSLQYLGGVGEDRRGLWGAMLLMALEFGAILLSRSRAPLNGDNASISSGSVWGNAPKANDAANQVTRIMEDILSVSAARACQIHTIPALFNSLAIHICTLCTSAPIARELAVNRSRVCMLGLTCLQESWPVSGWILKLFVDIIDRLRRRNSRDDAGLLATSGFGSQGSRSADSESARQDMAGNLPQRQQDDDLGLLPFDIFQYENMSQLDLILPDFLSMDTLPSTLGNDAAPTF